MNTRCCQLASLLGTLTSAVMGLLSPKTEVRGQAIVVPAVSVQEDWVPEPAPGPEGEFVRPFEFRSPQAEQGFYRSGRDLLIAEQNLQIAEQEIERVLNEVRSSTGERQLSGMVDLLQRVVKQQKQSREYLVKLRTMFTGDVNVNATLPGLERPDSAPATPRDVK